VHDAAGAQEAAHFAPERRRFRQVMEQAVRDHGVEAAIGEWQARQPRADEADP